jgi:hypothetical protein
MFDMTDFAHFGAYTGTSGISPFVFGQYKVDKRVELTVINSSLP